MNRLHAFILVALAALVAACHSPAYAAGPDSTPAQGLSIVVQPLKQAYAAGEPIRVDVLIRNTGASDASIGGSAFELSSFRFIVLDPSSRPVAETAYGKRLLAVPKKVTKNEPVRIRAGYQRRYEFDLAKMFDFAESGMYSITVKRVVVVSVKSTAKVILLSSDPAAITVAGTHTAKKPAAVENSSKPALRTTIAFVREGDIWVADGDGDEQRLIIHDGDSPSWSPDKTLIAFARKGNVWVSDPNGQNQRELTEASSLEAGVDPVFSPDGRWIAYRSWSQRVGIMIREVSIDGKIDKELIPDGESPAW